MRREKEKRKRVEEEKKGKGNLAILETTFLFSFFFFFSFSFLFSSSYYYRTYFLLISLTDDQHNRFEQPFLTTQSNSSLLVDLLSSSSLPSLSTERQQQPSCDLWSPTSQHTCVCVVIGVVGVSVNNMRKRRIK